LVVFTLQLFLDFQANLKNVYFYHKLRFLATHWQKAKYGSSSTYLAIKKVFNSW